VGGATRTSEIRASHPQTHQARILGQRALVAQAFLLRALGGYLFPGIPEAPLGENGRAVSRECSPKDACGFRRATGRCLLLSRNGMGEDLRKNPVTNEVVLSYLVAGKLLREAALFSRAVDLRRESYRIVVEPRPVSRRRGD